MSSLGFRANAVHRMAMGDGPKTKGQNLRTFVTSLRVVEGPHAVAATLERLPAEIRVGLGSDSILANAWYPVAWYAALHAAAAEATGRGLELARAIGREASRQDFTGIYRILSVVLSPQTVVARAPRVFASFWDTGSARVVEVRHGFVRLEFEGCAGYDARLWEDLSGAVESLIEVTGGRGVQARRLAGGGSESAMTIEYTWR